MGTRLDVKEWMEGHVGLGAIDYADGEREGKRAGMAFAYELLIQIDDIDRFVAEPTHAARLDGHVVWRGERCAFAAGEFNMLARRARASSTKPARSRSSCASTAATCGSSM